MSARIEVRFGDWIQQGFELYRDNLVLLLIVGLITMALTFVTVGVLGGPLLAGMILICLSLYEQSDKVPQVGDVFQGFGHFLHSFLFFLCLVLVLVLVWTVIGAIPCVGPVLALLGSYAVLSLVIFTPFFIVDRQMHFWPAVLESVNLVKTNFWAFFAITMVSGLLGSAGLVLCLVGVGLTLPIQCCILTAAYRDVMYSGPVDTTIELKAEPIPKSG